MSWRDPSQMTLSLISPQTSPEGTPLPRQGQGIPAPPSTQTGPEVTTPPLTSTLPITPYPSPPDSTRGYPLSDGSANGMSLTFTQDAISSSYKYCILVTTKNLCSPREEESSTLVCKYYLLSIRSFASDICKDPHLDDNREGIRYLDEKAVLVPGSCRDVYSRRVRQNA